MLRKEIRRQTHFRAGLALIVLVSLFVGFSALVSSPADAAASSAKLPHLFVLGDSISIHYGPDLEKMLAGVMTYQRKQAVPELAKTHPFLKSDNGGDSASVLAYLQYQFQQKDFHPDYLLLNCGLHDLKIKNGQTEHQVSLEQYEKNLRSILDLTRAKKVTAVWVRTTPVNDEQHARRGADFQRFNRDVIAYNEAADRIFRAARCPIIDLYTFTQNLGPDIHEDGVHFNESVRSRQGAFIGGFLGALDQNQSQEKTGIK